MIKTLYISDLDGTLLNDTDRLSKFTIETINKLIDEGMCFSYATARSLSSASIVTKGLRTDIPVIVYNGTFIRNAKTNEILYSHSFHQNEKREVVEFLNSIFVYPLVYSFIEEKERVSWVNDKVNEGMRRYLDSRKGDVRLRSVEDNRDLYDGEIFYFTCIGEKGELLPIYERFKESKKYNCILQQELYREEYWCEIMPSEATKGNAIKELKTILGCDRIVSFGDGMNDIPMFFISDECYAMENAVDGLKKVATGIIGSNNEDGVAHWLEKNQKISCW